MNIKKMMITMMCVMMISGPALAESPWADGNTYGEKVTEKLGYGLKNLLGGWTELISVPKEYAENDKGWLSGISQGVQNAVVYTLGGALHTGTFLFPQIDVEIQDGGVEL